MIRHYVEKTLFNGSKKRNMHIGLILTYIGSSMEGIH